MYGNGSVKCKISKDIEYKIDDLVEDLLKKIEYVEGEKFHIIKFIMRTYGKIIPNENDVLPQLTKRKGSFYEHGSYCVKLHPTGDVRSKWIAILKEIAPFFIPDDWFSNKQEARRAYQYFAWSVLIPKKEFFEKWAKLRNEISSKNIAERYTMIASILSKEYQYSDYEIIYWQWQLRDEFLKFVKVEDNLELATTFAQYILDNYDIENFYDILESFGFSLRDGFDLGYDFSPISEKEFYIYYSKLNHIDSKFLIAREFCDFFFDGEATSNEKDIFARTLFPTVKT